MASSSPTPSLTPSFGSSPPPNIPVQPDHFYDGAPIHATPDSEGKTWLDPDDDRLAARGIPVFKPTMEEFRDFEAFMTRVEPWGKYSGIVKVIPPQEWRDSLPPLKEQFSKVEIRTPIEQHMLGQAGLFRQQNFEKRKTMSVREWAEFCGQDEYRAPGVDEVGLHARANVKAKPRRTRKSAATKAETVEPEMEGQVLIKEEPVDEGVVGMHEEATTASATPEKDEQKPKAKGRRQPQTKQTKEAKQAERAEKDQTFLEEFDPQTHWLPPNTKPEDYTPEFCAKLERQYWRNCGLGKPPWYGADTQGSLYTDETTEWNVAHLESELSRLLPSEGGLPGVNTPYLYWGMWRATFAWHVEDMDLFSINYIHFGAPKFWYAVPQGRASALEQAMRGFFPRDPTQCHQFLRHKSFLASPTLLTKSSCKPNHCVQHAGEFMITFPRGYHAGFNLGLNCAESVNFALASWLELGKVAKACHCIPDSVRIDVNKLLEERDQRERDNARVLASPPSFKIKRKRPSSDSQPAPKKKVVKREEVMVVIPPLSKITKRKSEGSSEDSPKPKKLKTKPSTHTQDIPTASTSQPKPVIKIMPTKVTLKLGPRPTEPEVFPCCLCISLNKEGLLRVQDPPFNRKDAIDACGYPRDWAWMAHRECAKIVPETWVDEVETPDGSKEEVVFGVEGIVKDRWNLKCTACTKTRPKAHGAPIQCTKGKCPKAFHISCARDVQDNNIVFNVIREVEKEVVLLNSAPTTTPCTPSFVQSMQPGSAPGHPSPDANAMVAGGDMPTEPHPDADVLKIIKKFEVQLLCTQHNPALAAKKKASKQDRIKNDLLALPPMARIKIRVSSGVFEVTLLRVVEETSSVEVLWDRGSKREFKWGSVVFGNTEGPVQSKPFEAAPLPEFQPTSSHCTPAPSLPPLAAAAAPHNTQALQPSPSTSTAPPLPTNAAYGHYPPAAYGGYPYWTYPTPVHAPYGQLTNGYSYGTHYPTIPVATPAVAPPPPTPPPAPLTTPTPPAQPPTPMYSKFSAKPGAPAHASAPAPAQPPNVNKYYRNRQLQWQAPYQPPPASTSGQASQPPAQPTPQIQAYPHFQPQPQQGQTPQFQFTVPLAPSENTQMPVQGDKPMDSLQPSGSTTPVPSETASSKPTRPSTPIQADTTPEAPSQIADSTSHFGDPQSSQSEGAAITPTQGADIAKILSGLTPTQLTELIQNNPNLRNIVLSVMSSGEDQGTTPTSDTVPSS
ncbi:hypothetical protein AAF712_004728 [Marasmius tenuissimus]|uniref:[histone H3]-trimethyl-L-lysine(9) demethylase n=1 Tax=Marasmius tenuissimus TaxID=585030 RepID=A0ABR3A4S4_9AGAR